MFILNRIPNKEKTKKYTISLFFFLTLFAGTFYYLLRRGQAHIVIGAIKRADLRWLLVGLLFAFAYIGCDGINIRMLLKHQGKKISIGRGISYSLVGFYFSAVTPSATGGQPMQIYYMAKEGIGVGQSTLTLMFAQIMFHFSRLALGITLLFFEFPAIKHVVMRLRWVFFYGFVISVFLMVALSCLLFTQNFVAKIGAGLLNLGIKFKMIKNRDVGMEKLEKMLLDYRNGSKLITHHPMLVFKAFIIALLQIIFMLSIPFAVAKAFGVAKISFTAMLAIQVILTLSVDNLPLPGAVGVAEGAFMMVYRSFFGKRLLMPAMLLSRGIGFYCCMLIGGITTMIVHFRSIGKKTTEIGQSQKTLK